MDISRVERTLAELNRFGDFNNGLTRLAYSQEEIAARDYLITLCEAEGLEVRIDECGNVIARRQGLHPHLPAVAFGSHIDTVVQGGRYDGLLGVVAGLEVMRSLNDQELLTEHPLELISFTCEESSRFGVSTIGSKAMAGLLDEEATARLHDQEGISISEAFASCGLDFNQVAKAARKPEDLKAFVELHIEQGPLLEIENKQIGIVTGIAAPTRLRIRVQGQASHSGTTAMHLRKDALLGAAELALRLEEAAKAEAAQGTVATVGVMKVAPGAMNVVPGMVEMLVDIRSISAASKEKVFQELIASIHEVVEQRQLQIEWEVLSKEKPVPLNKRMIQIVTDICTELKLDSIHMPSGAGHDVMNMAALCPAALIFVPSKDGLSHHPDEFTSLEDIEVGIQLLEQTIIKLANAIPQRQVNLRKLV